MFDGICFNTALGILGFIVIWHLLRILFQPNSSTTTRSSSGISEYPTGEEKEKWTIENQKEYDRSHGIRDDDDEPKRSLLDDLLDDLWASLSQ